MSNAPKRTSIDPGIGIGKNSQWPTINWPVPGVVDSGWCTVARNGERRKTNVEESKRERLGGSFALSP